MRPQLSAGAFVFVAAAAAIMLASFIYVRKAAAGQRARAGMPRPPLPLLCVGMLYPYISGWPDRF